MPSAGQHMQQSNVIKEKKWQIKIIIRKTSYLNNIYWYKRCAPLGNVWYMLYTTACNQKRRLCLGVMWYLTCRGCRLDVDRGWFNHREHSCLQGLDDNSLGLYGSLGMSQGDSCNHGFWLDGNLRPNLNGPLDWRRLFVCMTVKVVGVKNTFFLYIYMWKWGSITSGGLAGLLWRFFGLCRIHRTATEIRTHWNRRELRLWWEGLILDSKQRTEMFYIIRM